MWDALHKPQHQLTLLRILSIPFLYALALTDQRTPFAILFFFAGLTDILDGWIARRNHEQSPFGQQMDRAADLLFVPNACIMTVILVPELIQQHSTILLALALCILTLFAIRLIKNTLSLPLRIISIRFTLLAGFLFIIYSVLFGYLPLAFYLLYSIIIVAFAEATVIILTTARIDPQQKTLFRR